MAEKSTFRFKLGFVEADGCEFYVNRYVDNGNWYFDIRNERGVVITCTVNPGERIEDDMVCIKDYSENSGLGNWLKIFGYIERERAYTIPGSGFVDFPVYRITPKLKAILDRGDAELKASMGLAISGK